MIEGASVAICARNIEDLRNAQKELNAYKADGINELLIYEADISDPNDVGGFVKFCASRFESVHILVNNAGVHGPKCGIDDVSFDIGDWIKAIHINLVGTMLMCKEVIPLMKRNNGGKIINLSGGGATSPMPGMSAYAASKAAVVRMTETFAVELKKYNIDVNAVAPGAMNTRLLDDVLRNGKGKVPDEYYDKLLKQKEGGGTPPDLAASLCVYLASEKSDGITGKLISAVWDDWKNLHERLGELSSDVYTLRRIVPEDRIK